MVTREEIVTKAREYIGTPFQDKGRMKGMALDCVGLLLCVGKELGLHSTQGFPIDHDYYAGYSAQPVGNFVQQACGAHMVRKALTAMQPGDVVTMAIPSAPCHVAIVGSGPHGLTLIHALDGGARKCVEDRLDYRWQSRIVSCFAYAGVE